MIPAMIFAAVVQAPADLAGTWRAERTGPQPGARAIVWFGPPDEVEHLVLYVRRAPDGSMEAFVRNPEHNAGARVGLRAVSYSNGVVRLRRDGVPDIVGTWSPQQPDVLVLDDPGFDGAFTFHRSRAATPASRYRYSVPAIADDGWQTASLQSANVDPAKIASIVEAIRATAPAPRAPYVQSLLVARHGKLVLDEYFNEYDGNRPHDVRSAGKSVTTLLVGRAIEDGSPIGPETRIASILTQYVPFARDDRRKQAITVGNLMSMSAGYACNDNDDDSPGNEDTMQSQTAQPDWYKYTLDLPMAFAPGTNAYYCSAEINLLGAIVAAETKRPLTEYFNEKFARPMQFGRYGMWLMPPPANQAYMAGGDLFLPRDFLKFGQLFLNGGTWNGARVIDPAWLRLIAQKHSFVDGGGGDYGYGWHLYDVPYRGGVAHAINAGGNGGQLLYVFPSLDLVILMTAANYGDFRVWHAYQTVTIPQILDADAP